MDFEDNLIELNHIGAIASSCNQQKHYKVVQRLFNLKYQNSICKYIFSPPNVYVNFGSSKSTNNL